MNYPRLAMIGALTLTAGLAACATPGHHGSGPIPSEPGQGAFGALAEVVSILENDPETDWAKVDIAGLRRHLVDMNALTLHAQVSSRTKADAVIFEVTGSGDTVRAIKAMVPAHAAQLSNSLQWNTETEITPNGAILTLKSADPKLRQRYKALGFFGVMATGSHHQMHHLQMARGGGHAH